MNTDWLGRPYYSLDAYLKHTYGEKCYKIALDANLSCPNRDGRTKTGGCLFCSAGGSGDFAQKTDASSVSEQLLKGRALFQKKKTGSRFIAYFQAYTNTYGPVSYLREIYTAALSLSDIVGISIATRPDCLGPDILALLKELKDLYAEKFIWIELGLQTIHEETASFLNRGYSLPVFEQAMTALSLLHIPVIVHVILGLPGETRAAMYETVDYLNHIPLWRGAKSFCDSSAVCTLKPFGVKLQLLHLLRGTALGELYETGRIPNFSVLTKEEYLMLLIHCLELLSPDIVIHRLTGDGPEKLLLAPLWSLNKRDVLNTLHKIMRQRNTYQGRCFYDAGYADPL